MVTTAGTGTTTGAGVTTAGVEIGVKAGICPFTDGIVITCPTCNAVGLIPEFAASRVPNEMPYSDAIKVKVSPDWIV